MKTCVTSLQLVALCDLRDVLAQTAQYCMMGNALSPEAVLVTWEGSTTSLDQLLLRTVKDGEHFWKANYLIIIYLSIINLFSTFT